MGRLFGYMGNEPDRVRCALYPVRQALATDVGVEAEGWGLGFYQGGEVLLQRRPNPQPGVVDFYGRLRELRTDVVIGQVRSAPPIPTRKTENAHPYRFRSWLFAHSGAVAAFQSIRGGLLEIIPDFLRRNIRGQGDSECLFHVFLAFLHDAGKLDDPEVGVEPAANAMKQAVAVVEQLSSAAHLPIGELNAIATNGRIMTASCLGRPMSLYRLSGIADCVVCQEGGVGAAKGTKKVAHEHLRAALILSNGSEPQGSGWESVPDGSIVKVTHSITTQVAPLRA